MMYKPGDSGGCRGQLLVVPARKATRLRDPDLGQRLLSLLPLHAFILVQCLDALGRGSS